jgi:hypothetical protein
MRHEEHDAQVALFRWAAMMSGKHPALEMLNASQNGLHTSWSQAAKAKAAGMKKGFPDVFLPHPKQITEYPEDGYFHGLFLEMKSNKGKISADQYWWKEHLEKAGYAHHFCYSWPEAANDILDYLDIPGKRIKP